MHILTVNTRGQFTRGKGQCILFYSTMYHENGTGDSAMHIVTVNPGTGHQVTRVQGDMVLYNMTVNTRQQVQGTRRQCNA